MRVLIVSGGNFGAPEKKDSPYHYAGEFDRIIAADSGLAHLHKAKIMPTDILGDFDSLKDRELLERYKALGIPVRTFPTRKDYTDTELAIFYAKDLGADEIVIYGATGTRYDHSLANISLMIPLKREGIHAVMVDAHNQMEIMIGPEKRIFKKEEDYPFFSILSLEEYSEGISMEGYSYPLEDYRLDSCRSLGISNEIIEEEGILSIKKGTLLVIRSRD